MTNLKSFSRARELVMIEMRMILLKYQQVMMSSIRIVCLFHQNLHQKLTKFELLQVLQIFNLLITSSVRFRVGLIVCVLRGTYPQVSLSKEFYRIDLMPYSFFPRFGILELENRATKTSYAK